MNKSLSLYINILSLTAALTIPAQMSSQQPRYRLIDMGTFGGPNSFLNGENEGNNAAQMLNSRGTLVGWADTPTPDPFAPDFCFTDSCFVSHAFQWKNGVRTDLGSLDSDLGSQAVWVANNGLIAGFSENGQFDPMISGLPESHAVLWTDRGISDLGTLEGGFESTANAVNSQGKVVGWSTNSAPDLNSMAAPGFFLTQTRALLWQNGAMRDLGTLGTGTDAMAQFINERGQIVGWSYTGTPLTGFCIFPLATGSFIWDQAHGLRDLGNLGGGCTLATGINDAGVIVGDNVNDQTIQRAFIWKDGKIQDLGGTLGGSQTGAEGINNSGQVAGFATLVGETFTHAALWRRVGEIIDLGAVGQDASSFASSINSKAQVVGASEPSGLFDNSTRAFLWDKGSIRDLNALIPPRATLHLQWAQDINDRGEITGSGLDASGNVHAYLLIPCNDANESDCQEIFADARATQFIMRSPIQTGVNPRAPRVLRRLARPLRQMRAQ